MIVTIDGPAGAGKSSTARRLARRLGFRFLDTGAMYRAAALAALRAGIDWQRADQVTDVIARMELRLNDEQVLLDGEDVGVAIRQPEVTNVIHFVADQPPARQLLVEMQRRIATGHDYVTEGRDQGSVAFPEAECKFFLTASAEERAKRRAREHRARGENVPWEEVLTQQTDRDRRDESRPVGRLVKAAEAVEIVTDGQTEEEVVDQLEKLVRQRMIT